MVRGQRRRIHVRLVDAPKRGARLRIHVAPRRAGVHRIHRRPLGQLPAPRARHGLDGRLAPRVHRLALVPDGRADARHVDDAARAVGGQERRRGLREEQRREHVDGVHAAELVGGDGALRRVVEVLVGCYAGVVDERVDLERARGAVGGKERARGGYDLRRGRGRVGEVGLDRGAPDAVRRRERRDEGLGARLGGLGCVCEDEVGALGG